MKEREGAGLPLSSWLLVVRYRTETARASRENTIGAVAGLPIAGVIMENSSDKKDESRESELPKAVPVPDESDDTIPIDDKADGNRAGEKMKDRKIKQQETHEEAKSITGSEAHHDPRNENPDAGPDPLKRY